MMKPLKIKTVEDLQKILFKICVLLFVIMLLLFSNKSFSQAVVVSEYFNDGTNTTEWSELVVVQDNVDMRNWTYRDNILKENRFAKKIKPE